MENKTLAEQKGEAPINWLIVIGTLEYYQKLPGIKNKHIYNKMFDWADNRSNDWVTCACGNRCSVIPRDDRGMPYDDELSDLGSYFHDEYIIEEDWDGARKCLQEIEERSTYLINEILENEL